MIRSIGPTNGVVGCRRKNCSTPMWRAGSVVGRSFVVLRLSAFLRAVPSCTPRHFDLAQQRLPTTCTMMATTTRNRNRTRTRAKTRTASLLWWTQVQTLPRPAAARSRPPRPTGAVAIGDGNSGGNAGNAIGVDDTYGDVPVDPQGYGGNVANSTQINVSVDGGTAIGDASGGDNHQADVIRRRAGVWRTDRPGHIAGVMMYDRSRFA